jgi:hypothetical protein
MLFFGKVRIDAKQLGELGRKLQTGELSRDHIKSIYCLADDPTVGLNVWEAADRDDLEQKLAPHRKYYAEVTDVMPVITSSEAQQRLIQQMTSLVK